MPAETSIEVIVNAASGADEKEKTRERLLEIFSASTVKADFAGP